MITEDYVSFEIAKLLKKKGFDIPTKYLFNENGRQLSGTSDYDWNEDERDCSRPSISLATKWLREVHNIHFFTRYYNTLGYTFTIQKLISGSEHTIGEFYPTHEEACESAIKHCLENLI